MSTPTDPIATPPSALAASPQEPVAWQRRHWLEMEQDWEDGWELIGKKLYERNKAENSPLRQLRALYASPASPAAPEADGWLRRLEVNLNHALMVLDMPASGQGKRAWASLIEARDAVEAALAALQSEEKA